MNHIIDILDNAPLASLSEVELQAIRAHAANCIDCARAFEAAQLTAMLLKERTSEAAESALNASPFFQTRVLAAWREQRSTGGAWSLRRLWNTTGALVASMAATTAMLAVFAFAAPSETTNQVQAAAVPYSAESIVFDQEQDDHQLTNDQVIGAVYDADEDK
ncbi:MAG TPA: hypothetical protein VNG71_02320 [Pyrinomonadaceae bacterium]|nr:hypothetical protein [Pyrinomonadaceae bacterium]